MGVYCVPENISFQKKSGGGSKYHVWQPGKFLGAHLTPDPTVPAPLCSTKEWRPYLRFQVNRPYPEGLRRGAHLPDIGCWARRWIDHWVCDAWPVRRQTYGYLPNCRASPPLGWYRIILLGGRDTWELLSDSGLAGSRTRDLSIPSHQTTHDSRPEQYLH